MLIAIRAHHLLRMTAMRAAGAAFCALLQFGFGPGAPIAPGWLIDWFVRDPELQVYAANVRLGLRPVNHANRRERQS